MTKAEIKQVGTRELWEQFARDPITIYRDTAEHLAARGLKTPPTLTQVLEERSPTEAADRSGTDAFERMMMEAGIITRSNPFAGYWASPAIDFDRNKGTRTLLTEFFHRNWRKVSFGGDLERRDIVMSSDFTPGSWANVWQDAASARLNQQIAAAIPLSEITAMTTPIDGDAYRSFYLTYDEDAVRMFRVGETAEIPRAQIVGAEHTVRLLKYARGIEASYEALRRMRTDKFALFTQWMAVQNEIDKVAGALDIMINGDGNSNTTPTSYNLTTLDTAATIGTLTLTAWLAFKLKFVQPYIPTTALMREDVALQLALLNVGSGNVPLEQARLAGLNTSLTPINQTADGVRYGWLSDAPASKIIMFDRRVALERVTETGANITEVERYANKQTEVLFRSEVEGFAVMDANAVKILNLAA